MRLDPKTENKWIYYELTIDGDKVVEREEYPAIRRPYCFDELKVRSIKLFWQDSDK